jgi:tetratricopeptide (TPR) repeat protein
MMVSILFTGVLAAKPQDKGKFFLSGIDFELYDKGLKLMDQGKLEEAAETFLLLTERKSNTLYPFFYLAGLYSQLGKHQEAAAVYEKILHRFPLEIRKLGRASYKNPFYSQFYYNLGVAYLGLNRHQDAVNAFKRVIRSRNYKADRSSVVSRFYPTGVLAIKTFYATVHYHLGLAYLSLGDQKAAVSQYKKLKKLDKDMATEFQKEI